MDMAPVSVTHQNVKRAISVLGKVRDRTATEVTNEFIPTLDAMQKNWPAGYQYALGGEAQETAETFASAGAMLVIAIILVFSVLVLIFGSFAQSLIIMATMPLAMIGTFLGFFALQIPFSFFAMVGVIALIGIVINDAIVMIDTMNRHLLTGMAVAEAAAHGAADRLRPIISTSLTTIVGLIPLAISNPMWRPLCYAVIFGLMASTLLALIVVPCLYLLLTRDQRAENTQTENQDIAQPLAKAGGLA
jgi:multidrug efflux pump subunit AcrB